MLQRIIRHRSQLVCVCVVLIITLYLLNDAVYKWINPVCSTRVKHVTVHDKSGVQQGGINDIERGKVYETDGTDKPKGSDEEMNAALQIDTQRKQTRNKVEDAVKREGVKRTDDNENIPKDTKKEDIMKGVVTDVGTIIRTAGKK